MDNLDYIGNSVTPCSKRESVESEVEPSAKKMMPSLFLACHPISNVEDIALVIKEPPKWTERVEPLVPRASTVVQNIISDCHSDTNHFLTRSRTDARVIPKTLVCHDYKGGYQADKYLHFKNENIVGNGYTFYNWEQIDIFVYFSHHLITIPPLCWINAGHKHGVKVLGTLITESESGAELCNKKIFKNSETMRSFAKSVVELTKIFGFDGWLLNIENAVEKYELLKEFVVYFTDLVHAENKGNVVIWYDSVTDKGELKWQNELNEKNRFFFDACDGIFLNYSWTEKQLINTVEVAKHRNHDVFVGIDVFGRNMFGGGMFNTYKAAEMVTRYNLSMAIFAPGWAHETLGKSDQFFKQFLDRDSAFWCSLWPYMYTHPINKYFTTDFYIGLDQSCYNIFNQQRQISKFLHPNEITIVPNHEDIPTLCNKCSCLQIVMNGSRNSCLLTRKNLRRDVEYVHHLFVCDLEIVDNTVVYFVTKSSDHQPTALTVTMLLCGANNAFRKVRLLGRRKEQPVNNASILEVNQTDASDVYDNLKNKFVKMVEDEQWCLSIYVFNTPQCRIMEVGGTLEGGESIYLGAFGIENADGEFLKNI